MTGDRSGDILICSGDCEYRKDITGECDSGIADEDDPGREYDAY